MQSSKPMQPKRVKGWLFDVYPSDVGEVTVFGLFGENGEMVKLRDGFQPKIYVSGSRMR
jgi:hypothetical protein